MCPNAKILAIDDEHDLLLIVRSALQAEGYEVYTASNGTAGLDLAQRVQPDLIILDVMMPELDGFQVLDQLREKDTTRAIPVIMLTALADRGKIRDAIEKGTEFYIVKPLELSDLLSKVKIVLKASKEEEPI